MAKDAVLLGNMDFDKVRQLRQESTKIRMCSQTVL
jgi:hypothetical protein